MARKKKESPEIPNIIIPTYPTVPPPQQESRKKVELPPPGEILRAAGVLLLTTEFNQETIMPLVRQILEWNLMDPNSAPEHIKLYINSPGGSVHSAFHLIDTMKQSRIPVHTIGMGLIASCGVLTMMAGEKGHRYITQNTSVMSHQYAWGSQGKEHELMARVKEFEMSTKRMIDHYKKCTGKDEKYIRKELLAESDHWLSAEETIKHGIADHVIQTY